MNETDLLIAKIEDKYDRSRRDYMVTATGFLDLAQQSIVRTRFAGQLIEAEEAGAGTEQAAYPERDSDRGTSAQAGHPATGTEGDTRVLLAGGYADAERCICLFVPDYVEDMGAALAEELCVLRIAVSEHEKPPKHGDYLGSLVGLGISRELLGDILVRTDGADVLAVRGIADFLQKELARVGRVPVTTEIKALGELRIPEHMYKEKTDSVASLRLDGIVAAAFGLSRERAKEEIGRGLCFVNHTERKKIDSEVRENDVINLRHHGKVKLTQVGGMTRKGRISITYRIY